jgi:hypothetical protein
VRLTLLLSLVRAYFLANFFPVFWFRVKYFVLTAGEKELEVCVSVCCVCARARARARACDVWAERGGCGGGVCPAIIPCSLGREWFE